MQRTSGQQEPRCDTAISVRITERGPHDLAVRPPRLCAWGGRVSTGVWWRSADCLHHVLSQDPRMWRKSARQLATAVHPDTKLMKKFHNPKTPHMRDGVSNLSSPEKATRMESTPRTSAPRANRVAMIPSSAKVTFSRMAPKARRSRDCLLLARDCQRGLRRQPPVLNRSPQGKGGTFSMI
jgi:hypothetical protein